MASIANTLTFAPFAFGTKEVAGRIDGCREGILRVRQKRRSGNWRQRSAAGIQTERRNLIVVHIDRVKRIFQTDGLPPRWVKCLPRNPAEDNAPLELIL